MQADAHRSRRVSHHDDLVPVTSKLLNVLVDPPERLKLVFEGDVQVEVGRGLDGNVRRDWRRTGFGR